MSDTNDRRAAPSLRLEAPGVLAVVSATEGGRLASLAVGGQELLVTEGMNAIEWGAYPLVPFGGRVRHGSFEFRGQRYQLPRTMPPHAIHGTVFGRSWTVLDDRTVATDLGPDWPFAGRVTQRFLLAPDRLDISLTLEADEAMPAMLGWHPWFRRQLVGTAARPLPPSSPVTLAFEPGVMYARDDEGIATGALVEPGPPPWDDCFTDVRAAPVLRWPDRLALEISSSLDHWVVYTERAAAVCVEPQGGPPDALNHDPAVAEPGRPMRAQMSLRWWGQPFPRPTTD